MIFSSLRFSLAITILPLMEITFFLFFYQLVTTASSVRRLYVNSCGIPVGSYLGSMGVPIAVAANRSFIAETATMTVHPIRLTGLVIGVPQTYEYLDKMQDRVVRFVTEHSRISEEKFRELMFRTGELARDIGTVLVGRDAVEVGLIDEVGGLSQAVNHLKTLIAEGAPGPGGLH
ncbi:hypothetical protein TAMC210_21120 [Thermanaeromonas sp. C210]|nr:hypothetical protein TAMC210_21120 [Thermanaeromonas sp. C210]